MTAVAKAHLDTLRYRQLHDRQDSVNLILLTVRDLDGAHLATDLRLLKLPIPAEQKPLPFYLYESMLNRKRNGRFCIVVSLGGNLILWQMHLCVSKLAAALCMKQVHTAEIQHLIA